jgi:hypothetical protein
VLLPYLDEFPIAFALAGNEVFLERMSPRPLDLGVIIELPDLPVVEALR